MVRVGLWGSLRPAAGGAATVEIDADTVRGLLRELEAAHPGTRPFIEEGIAVSIDGVVFQNSPWQAIPSGAEVFLLPRLKGG